LASHHRFAEGVTIPLPQLPSVGALHLRRRDWATAASRIENECNVFPEVLLETADANVTRHLPDNKHREKKWKEYQV
jgi:hypothetical protein